MAEFLLASAIIFGVLAGWIWVQQAYAAFARRNPDLGPFRPEGGGCGGGCSCGGGHCRRGGSEPEGDRDLLAERSGWRYCPENVIVPAKEANNNAHN